MPEMTRASVGEPPSQIRSLAWGYTPTIPRPFSGAAASDATAVPWYSTSDSVSRWVLRIVVFGRPANSEWLVSSPVSTIVSGLPGPGGVTRSAPISGRQVSV